MRVCLTVKTLCFALHIYILPTGTKSTQKIYLTFSLVFGTISSVRRSGGMADAQASGACYGNIVWVQVPSPASQFNIGMRGSVGTGRRARLRILWWVHRVGSSPIFRIIKPGLIEHSMSPGFLFPRSNVFFVILLFFPRLFF